MSTPTDTSLAPQRLDVRELARRIHDLEAQAPRREHAPALITDWVHPVGEADPLVARLAGASVHEFIGIGPWHTGGQERPGAGRDWTPPLCVLVHLAHQAALQRPGAVVFVGRRCWPYAHQLARGPSRGRLLAGVLLVDASDTRSRLWATEVCLRSSAAALVVADASGMSMPASRRLQLAAETGGMALLTRPAWELGVLSSSATRWTLAPDPAARAPAPGWVLTLRRVKSVLKSAAPCERSWLLEWDPDHARVRLSADAARRPAAAPRRPLHLAG